MNNYIAKGGASVGRLRKKMARLLEQRVGAPIRAEDISIPQGGWRRHDVYRWHVLTHEEVPFEFFSWDTLTDCVKGFTVEGGEIFAVDLDLSSCRTQATC